VIRALHTLSHPPDGERVKETRLSRALSGELLAALRSPPPLLVPRLSALTAPFMRGADTTSGLVTMRGVQEDIKIFQSLQRPRLVRAPDTPCSPWTL
jgi:hypothetical protein